MAQPPPRRSHILNLFDAGRSLYGAALDIREAIDAGKCVVCAENPVEPPAKVCDGCAEKGGDVARRVAAPFIGKAAGALEDALGKGLADLLKGNDR